MPIEIRKDGPVLVVKLLERALDAFGADGFRDRVSALIQQGHQLVVLDLEGVEFLDSAGLGAVIACRTQIGPGGSIALCSCGPAVLQVLRMARMDRVLTIAADAKEAVASLAAGAR
jgi:anti-sigma B factor antagonist